MVQDDSVKNVLSFEGYNFMWVEFLLKKDDYLPSRITSEEIVHVTLNDIKLNHSKRCSGEFSVAVQQDVCLACTCLLIP